MVLDALDEDLATRFYQTLGFIQFPSNPNRLFLSIGTIKQLYAEAE